MKRNNEVQILLSFIFNPCLACLFRVHISNNILMLITQPQTMTPSTSSSSRGIMNSPPTSTTHTAPPQEPCISQAPPAAAGLLERVCERNNIGVGHFERKEYSVAFRCFREALVLLKTRVQDADRINQSTKKKTSMVHTEEKGSAATAAVASPTSDILPLSSTSACMALGEPSPCSSLLLSSDDEEDANRRRQLQEKKAKQDHEAAWGESPDSSVSSCFAVHSQCFRFLPPSDTGILFSTDPICEDRLISAVIVFNCALAFHLQGQQTCSFGHLKRATSLYQQAVLLLDDEIHKATLLASSTEKSASSSTSNPLVELLCMACLNNMGLILRCEFLDHDTSRRCFDQLAFCAHAFDPEVSSTTEEDDDDEQEQVCSLILIAKVDEFLLNAVALSCVDQVCAPAA